MTSHVEALGISNIINFHRTGREHRSNKLKLLAVLTFWNHLAICPMKSWWGRNNLWSSTSRTSASQTILCWRHLSHNVSVIGVRVVTPLCACLCFASDNPRIVRCGEVHGKFCGIFFGLEGMHVFSLVDAPPPKTIGQFLWVFHRLPHHHKEFMHMKLICSHPQYWPRNQKIPETFSCLSKSYWRFTWIWMMPLITGVDDGSLLPLLNQPMEFLWGNGTMWNSGRCGLFFGFCKSSRGSQSETRQGKKGKKGE